MAKKETNNTSIKRDLVDLTLMTLGGIGGGALANGIAKSTVHSNNPLVNAGLLVLKTGGVFEGASIGHKLSNIIFENNLKESFGEIKDVIASAKKDPGENEAEEAMNDMDQEDETTEDDLF